MAKYPSEKDKLRIQNYKLYEELFLGEHFEAFSKIHKNLRSDFETIRFIAVNFAGMLSRLSADMLFEEFPIIRFSNNNKELNEWLANLFHANNLRTQFYESALEGSYRGDIVFRIRAEDGKCIVEDINPESYVAIYDSSNTRKEPTEHWIVEELELAGLGADGKPMKGVLIEKHLKGIIRYELWTIESEQLGAQLDIKQYFPDLEIETKTGINDFLVFHSKNWGINSRYYGISDYNDIVGLFYAIDNRTSRIDNILDKHGDPILAVPPGVLNENGEVKKEAFGLIEVDFGESKGSMPQYIVWDAKLESAFKQIDYLMEFLYMISETSKSAFGVDKDGIAESGRALKFKLLRTIAKKHRKELYFDRLIKEVIKTAMEFTKANKLTVEGQPFPTNAKIELPEIVWQDGIINDLKETIENEETKLSAKLTTRADAITTIEGITPEEAEIKVKKIDDERAKMMPTFTANPLNPNDPMNKKNVQQ